MDLPRIILMVGLPGSGKSTWLAQRGITPLSSDEIRRLLTDDATNQSVNRQVFATLRYLLRRRLELGARHTYIDATHLTPRERRPYIKMGHLLGATVDALYFDTPLEVCQQRNRQRARIVPPEVIDWMAARLRPPAPAEGFERIEVVTCDRP